MNRTSQNHQKTISDEDKQLLAYNLWERANRPEGQAVDFWIEAERLLEAELNRLAPAKPAGKSKKSAAQA